MRVALTLEAHDKASRAVRNMAQAVTGLNKSATAGATKAAAATAKATKATEAGAKAARAAEKAARGAGRAGAEGAARASRGQQLAARAALALDRAYSAAGRGARAAGNAARAAGQMAEQGWKRALVAVENYARRQAAAVRAGIGQMGSGARQVGQGLLSGGKVAAGVATGAGVLGGAAALATNWLVKPAAQNETYLASLEGSERSAAGAKKAQGWIQDFAGKTPYGVADTTEAFIQMRAYGLEPMNGALLTLGDTASAMNKPVMQAVEALADAVTGENERLKEFGVKASKQGKYFEYAFTDKDGNQKTLKALANDRKAIENALMKIWGDKFAGGMERQSQTWNGLMAGMGDKIEQFQLKIMNAGAFDFLKGKLTEVIDLFDVWTADGTLDVWATRISEGLIEAMKVGWEVTKGLGAALSNLARAAEWVANAIGGWENFAYLALAVAFAGPLFTIASGLFLIGKGALVASLAVGRLGIMFAGAFALNVVQSALQLTWLAMRGGVGATMLLGRSLIFLTAMAGRAAIAMGVGLARAAMGLPVALAAGGGGLRAFGAAMIGLPGRLLAVARGIGAMTVAGLRALPGALMGAARGFLAMGAAGLRALPGLMAGAARGVALMAGAGLKALPGLLMAAARGFVMLGASLMATPVGWVIAGVAAIAAAAYLIYDNWGAIGPWLAEQWETIKTAVSGAWDAISGFDWSSILPDFEWSSLLPSWDWLQLIPAIALPSFAWRELLPSWDWGSIIPSLPDFSSWFGGDNAPAAPATPATPAAPADDPKALAAQAALARQAIEALQPAAQAAVTAASAVLAGASFHSHGVALMTTLAAGIRAGAGAAVAAVQGVTQQMRDYLPHSPAKVGPLSDLDKIRFSETLAGAVRPGPAVAAARSVAAGMRAAVAAPISAGLALSPVPVSAGLPMGAANGGAGGAGGAPVSVSVQYSPSLSVPAGTAPAQAASFEQQLREHSDVVAKLVEEAVRRAQRKEF